MSRFKAAALLLLLLCQVAMAQVQVRVLLEQVDSVELHMPGAHSGLLDGQTPFETALPLDWPLAADGGTLLVDGRAVGHSLRLEPATGLSYWNGQEYRGALTFVARDSTLLVLNTLDVEDYLRGVVPAEMQANWPAEALKAQAIAARSYVLNSLAPLADYDICATQDCQVYRGTALEHPASDSAITATRGLVLTYQGSFARTYYHSDSGGALASSSEVWGEAYPYLQARPDVAAESPHRSWSQQLDPLQLGQRLSAMGHALGTVSRMEILETTASGRVASLRVSGMAGSVVLSGSQATALLRGLGLKSTRFRMTGPLSVSGDGWGHGVGMSQYGALSLARAGYAFDDILSFYYPSTELSRLTVLGSVP